MLEATEVEHSHTTVSTARHEHIDAVGTEANIKYLLVVGYKLRLCRQSGYVPDSASGINTGGDY